jgi:hypothetical protein
VGALSAGDSPRWRLSPAVRVWINRVLDPAPRTCLPPAGSCPEVGGYMRGVVEKRSDSSPWASSLLLAPSQWLTPTAWCFKGPGLRLSGVTEA